MSERPRTFPVLLGSILDSALNEKPAGKRLREGRIWNVWKQAVGTQIAARAVPVRFSDGVLTVAVESPPWMQQLTFLKGELCRQVNARLGEELVREIQLKAGRRQPQGPPPPRPPVRRPLDAAELQQAEQEATAISDQELRESYRRLRESHLAFLGRKS